MHSALAGLQHRARRHLLVKTCFSEADESEEHQVIAASAKPGVGAAENLNSGGTPTWAAPAPPCPSRDRARASLRRLHPTALCCAEPAAPAAATEPGGLDPLSRPLPAAAPAGGGGGLAVCWYRKALPWAHLAPREQAAAAEAAAAEVITSGRNGDGYEEVETVLGKKKKTKKQPAAAQDWSWLASPPWGVAPLPPELSSRVDWQGWLRPGAGGASSASASAAPAAAAAQSPAQPLPQPHPDPHCARLHAQLHRTAAAVQQVLAVAAAAAAATAAADVASRGAPTVWAPGSPLHGAAQPPLITPPWVQRMSFMDGGDAAMAKIAAIINTLTLAGADALGGGPDKPPARSPLQLLGSTNSAEQRTVEMVVEAGRAAVAADLQRRADCERLQPVLGPGFVEPSPHLLPTCGAPSSSSRAWQGPGQGHIVMAAWRGGRAAVRSLLALLLSGTQPEQQRQREVEAWRGSPWRQLVPDVLQWADASREWAWLMEMAAAAEEAEAGVGAATAAAVGKEDAGVLRAWGDAATEVLRGATCWLGLYAVLTGGLPAEAHAGGHGGFYFDRERLLEVMDETCGMDPLAMALAFPIFLLARALEPDRHVSPIELYDTLLLGQLPAFPDLHWPTAGPAANRSPAARRRGGPPPPPLSYSHCVDVLESFLREPQATITMFRALFDQPEHISKAVGELVWSWHEAWVTSAPAESLWDMWDAKVQLQNGLELAREVWRRGRPLSHDDDDDVRSVLVEMVGTPAAAAAAAAAGVCLDAALAAGIGDGAWDAFTDQEVAEARADLQEYARAFGVADVLAALPEYRPPATALAAALRALLLLRIVPGSVPPAAYMTPEAARLASAGAAAADTAAMTAAGGGCELVRLRVPPGGNASAAALLICMIMDTLALAPATAAAGSCLLFLPAFRAGAAQPLAAAAGAAGRARAAPGGASSGGGGGCCGGGALDDIELDVCRAFKPAWPQSDADAVASKWPYAWLAIRELAVAQWTPETTVSEMLFFLRRSLLERHLGICAAGVQGVAALGRVLVALAKLRQELRPPAAAAAAAAAAPARDVAVQINCVLEYGDEPAPQPPHPPLEALVAQLQRLVQDLALALPFGAQRRQLLTVPAPPGPPGSNGSSNGSGKGSSRHPQPAEPQTQTQTLTLLEVLPEAGVDGDLCPPHGHAHQGPLEQAQTLLRSGLVAEAELAAAAVLSQLRRENDDDDDDDDEEEEGARHRRREARRKLPRHHLKLDVWFHEVPPGRPWELVLPPAERVAEWNRRMGKVVFATRR
ncbi:hypothetical protein HXX76_006390 [Chlamydomonas incerta]|uniref:Uncharacterized protein n=1 Tax=Chlamydomonas incerta TaxID=51695 RepID=A0A835W2I1_CHLIN|nr:hypothetical protein HXX76_006390 [Chlamydomonas incerta]|eukprot:KAG2436870.1 hypothetical protein HXX76_006390 [Chlamydomonas incerta]